MNKEFDDIAKIISGEMALEKKQKALEKAKKEAIKEQKDRRRDGIEKGRIKLEQEEETNKVVQNIKLFSWEANDRLPIKYNNKSFLILVAASLAFILLLAVLGHYFLMGCIIAFVFLIYVLGTTKPQKLTHIITARGVETGNKLYQWYLLKNFYFSNKEGQIFMIIETYLNVPGALVFLVGKKDQGPLFVLLQEKLLYKDIRKQSWLEKQNYGTYIPLEEV